MTIRSNARWLLVGLALCARLAQSEPARPDPEQFARPALIQNIALSPDGQRYAFLAHREGRDILALRSVKGDRTARSLLTNGGQHFSFSWIRWVSPDLLLAALDVMPGGRPRILMEIPLDGSAPRELVSNNRFTAAEFAPGSTFRLLATQPGKPARVLVALTGADSNQGEAVYEIDVESGEHRLVHEAQPRQRGLVLDMQRRTRVARSMGQNWDEILIDSLDGRGLRLGWRLGRELDGAVPLGFGANPNLLYVSARHLAGRAVFTVDLREPTLKLRLLAEPADPIDWLIDISDVRNNQLVGVFPGSKQHPIYWAPEFRDIAKLLSKALPNHLPGSLQLSDDGLRYLVPSSEPGQPVQYLIGDLEHGQLSLLEDSRPDVQDSMLSPIRLVRLPLRGGKTVDATVTLPRGKAGEPLPTVIISRLVGEASMGYHAISQMIASRGWAVLTLPGRVGSVMDWEQFEATVTAWWSTGYEDLVDAAAWLKSSGLSQPGRICLLGQDEGSHAVLMAAAHAPEQFACLIAREPLADLTEAGKRLQGLPFYQLFVGYREGSFVWDGNLLRQLSAVRLASNIRVPTLLTDYVDAQGRPDEVTRRLIDALTRAGRAPQLRALNSGGMAPETPQHLRWQRANEHYFAAIAEFLDARLAAHPAAPTPAAPR
ncbi:prolyl oligopeptidase family serine peptidase [Pelomonas sp. SE-A7]|uniref:S9 family peptidase n=1 Tax=Pelomonas sp. SE-A7 TaxID=3054953 RepID=UPI00259CDF1D|nr:prolyl oligopeptidase family serine peptidase [Pelomonas sp. SE-A7]MDM4766272.1 prolyl oligopeptidase family serine peptidase [Pelomonas sp. SE-A7]